MNKVKLKQPQWLPIVLWAVAIVVIAVALLVFEFDYLWKVQELNLFLSTPLFFKQQMVVSGGLLTYLGTYFTQFFFHPVIGVCLLCGWWVLLCWSIKGAFRLPTRWILLTLIPVSLLLLTDVDMGYWIYYLKLRGHFFIATIGTTAAVALLWLFRLLPSRFQARTLFALLSPCVSYPLFGFYGLLASLLMAAICWRLTDMRLRDRLICTLATLFAIAWIPQVYYRHFYYETLQDNIYWTALPIYELGERFAQYYIPYYLLTAFLLTLAFSYMAFQRARRSWGCWAWGGAQLLLLAALSGATYQFWYKDYNFHKELRMQRCIEQQDWYGTMLEAANQKVEPTRAIVTMRNLALFRLGKQGDAMYYYKTGAKKSNTPLPLNLIQVAGRLLYYNYGQLNYCYRWCLEDGVEFGWRAEYYKYLIRCSLINGDFRVARKYIIILKHTRYQRAWAEQQEQYLNHPEAISQSKEYGVITQLMDYDNELSSDNALIEQYLMTHLVSIDSNNPLQQELSLLAALWTKDIATFWPRFFHYAQLHQGARMPIHYQEAAYLYGHLEHQVDISNMPFDDSVKSSYEQFMAMAQQCAGMSEEQIKEALYPRFGHTYYYEYFLIRNQKQY